MTQKQTLHQLLDTPIVGNDADLNRRFKTYRSNKLVRGRSVLPAKERRESRNVRERRGDIAEREDVQGVSLAPAGADPA
eukprot:11588503-Alexandrium_andersonii.AAC.1